MKCRSCNGTGKGPMGEYSPRAPICLGCNGTGESLIECFKCGNPVPEEEISPDGLCEACETKNED